MHYKKTRTTYYDCETMKKITLDQALEIEMTTPGEWEEFFSNEKKTILIYWKANGGQAMECHIYNLETMND